MITKHMLLGALLGLIGACEMNSKTSKTDDIVCDVIIEVISKENNEESWINIIHNEKYCISPDCAVCKNPCGNTSDFIFDGYRESDFALAEEMLVALKTLAEKIKLHTSDNHKEAVILLYTAIAAIRYIADRDYFQEILLKVKNYR